MQRDGHWWLAKAREDWWNECRLTPKQFDRAIRHLEAKHNSTLRSDIKGANPQMWAEDLLFREFPSNWRSRFLFEVKK